MKDLANETWDKSRGQDRGVTAALELGLADKEDRA